LDSNWQPIETAPKDGTAILIYEPPPNWPTEKVGVVYVVVWESDYVKAWVEADGERYRTFDDSTHWMPLPQPPE